MKNRLSYFWLAAAASAAVISGCGGVTAQSATGNAYNGIYRSSVTRGNTAVTVYLNYPTVEVVVTDEASVLPSFVGTGQATIYNGNVAFGTSAGAASGIPLTGSDGESAQASGVFAPDSNGSGNAINLYVTGGVGFNAQIAATTTTTNSLFAGTYSGSDTTQFAVGTSSGTTTTTEPAGTATITLAADSNTGGYDLSGSGSTYDPSGKPVSYTIGTGATVDPCGIVSNLTITYTYAGGTPSPVTNTFTSAYLNLGVVANTTLVGYMKSSTTNWSTGASQIDQLVLTQTATGLRKKAASLAKAAVK